MRQQEPEISLWLSQETIYVTQRGFPSTLPSVPGQLSETLWSQARLGRDTGTRFAHLHCTTLRRQCGASVANRPCGRSAGVLRQRTPSHRDMTDVYDFR
jgi:hypothetical protein